MFQSLVTLEKSPPTLGALSRAVLRRRHAVLSKVRLGYWCVGACAVGALVSFGVGAKLDAMPHAVPWPLASALLEVVAPVGFGVSLLGLMGMSVLRDELLGRATMDDGWLGAVAGLAHVPKPALDHLHSRLTEQGWVSVADGLRWTELVRSEVRLEEAARFYKGPGARKLLARKEAGAAPTPPAGEAQRKPE